MDAKKLAASRREDLRIVLLILAFDAFVALGCLAVVLIICFAASLWAR